MRRRILTSILAVTALAIVLFGVPLAIVIARVVDEEATLRLERQAILAARDVPADFATNGDPVELADGSGGARLALYGVGGQIVVGNGPANADAAVTHALENVASDTELNGSRVVAVPVTANEEVTGAIRAEETTASTSARTWRIVALLVGLALAVFAVGAGVAALVARRLARPVRHLSDATIELGEGNFAVSVEASGIPEIDDAGASLIATAHRLDDLVSRERAFSSDASHQLRTPLAGLRAAIETELEFPRDDRTEVLRESLDDIDRLERTIADLLHLARTPANPVNDVDLAAVIADVSGTWHGRFAAVRRPLRIDDFRSAPRVRGTGIVLNQVFDVLLDNALVHGAGEVSIGLAVANTSVTITVKDESPEFEIASTSPGFGGTHGLGLPLASRLLDSISGKLVMPSGGPRSAVDVVLLRPEDHS